MDTFGVVKPSKMAPRVKGEIIVDTMKRLGPTVTLEEVNQEIRRLGGTDTVETVFEKNYKKVFNPSSESPEPVKPSETMTPVQDEAKVISVVMTALAKQESTTTPNIPVDPDKLTRFVRFSIAVEAVGGLNRAKKYLQILEDLLRDENL